jgi:hypothetical protein
MVRGRSDRVGLRLSAKRLTVGSKLMADGVLVTLSGVLLAGPPVATYLLPRHKVIPPSALPAVSTSRP